jgi:aryl-alcohol dehydrogenase-like predicted oxidoreductase
MATRDSPVPRRPLGRSGRMVSAIGLGGFHLGGPDITEAQSISLIRAAIDAGIDFLDNSWDYNEGKSEIRMGKALADGYRDRAFLMTKIDGQTRESAAQQIDESLRRLKTDRVDLLQFHEIIRMSDADRIFAAGGALEAVLAAQKAGKIQYIGFTGHKSPDIHLKMLDTAAGHGFRFDTVQLPLNVLDAHYDSFEKKVLPRLVSDGIGVLGMKPLGDGSIPAKGLADAVECLHYALNLPTSVVITGCESMERLDQALEAVLSFRPFEPQELKMLLDRTSKPARDGKHESYKTTDEHDSTDQHPQWLG